MIVSLNILSKQASQGKSPSSLTSSATSVSISPLTLRIAQKLDGLGALCCILLGESAPSAPSSGSGAAGSTSRGGGERASGGAGGAGGGRRGSASGLGRQSIGGMSSMHMEIERLFAQKVYSHVYVCVHAHIYHLHFFFHDIIWFHMYACVSFL